MGIKIMAADKYFSLAIRHRDNHQCQYCWGLDGKMECAHIHSRRHRRIRWDATNAVTLCNTHHRYFTEEPFAWVKWLTDTYGEGYLDILLEKRNTIMKSDKTLRAEIAKHYREELKRMERDNTRDLVSWI
jgi:hypothetical protein